MDFKSDSWKSLPDSWRQQLTVQLGEGEALVGWFETDLDHRLHYASGLVVVTDRRLLASQADSESAQPGVTTASNSEANGQPTAWQSWPLSSDLELRWR